MDGDYDLFINVIGFTHVIKHIISMECTKINFWHFIQLIVFNFNNKLKFYNNIHILKGYQHC